MLLVFGAALALAGATVNAQAGPTRSPPLKASEFSALIGHWHGAGSFTRTGAPVESELEVATAASGEAIELHLRELPPNKFVYAALWTADTVNGGIAMMLAGNNGGGGRLLRSAGWRAGCLVFTSAPPLQAWFATERFSFCRQPDDRLNVTYELSRDAGATWISGDVQTYTRS